MKKIFFLPLFGFLIFSFIPFAFARSSKTLTLGPIAIGNIQLLNTFPQFDPGPGGGVYFDYRFNQRFSLTIDAWATVHQGSGISDGDNDIVIMGLPTATLKLYLLDDEASKWDPYLGVGLGAYATTEGSLADGTNGVGLGAQIDVGIDYHFTDVISVGFDGIFRSMSIITSLSNSGNNALALIPYSLVAKVGFHF